MMGGAGITNSIVSETSKLTSTVSGGFFQNNIADFLNNSGLIFTQKPTFFDVSFWQQLIATIVGVVLGIPAALWVNRKIEQKHSVKKKKELLVALEETLLKNKTLLEQMKGELGSQIIFYNVDTTLLESLSSLKYELISNIRLNQKLDDVRYELQHLHRKVELQLSIAYGSFRAIGGYRGLE